MSKTIFIFWLFFWWFFCGFGMLSWWGVEILFFFEILLFENIVVWKCFSSFENDFLKTIFLFETKECSFETKYCSFLRYFLFWKHFQKPRVAFGGKMRPFTPLPFFHFPWKMGNTFWWFFWNTILKMLFFENAFENIFKNTAWLVGAKCALSLPYPFFIFPEKWATHFDGFFWNTILKMLFFENAFENIFKNTAWLVGAKCALSLPYPFFIFPEKWA